VLDSSVRAVVQEAGRVVGRGCEGVVRAADDAGGGSVGGGEGGSAEHWVGPEQLAWRFETVGLLLREHGIVEQACSSWVESVLNEELIGRKVVWTVLVEVVELGSLSVGFLKPELVLAEVVVVSCWLDDRVCEIRMRLQVGIGIDLKERAEWCGLMQILLALELLVARICMNVSDTFSRSVHWCGLVSGLLGLIMLINGYWIGENGLVVDLVECWDLNH
jgi:hypothetical protein